jgi:hypothetical protein
LLVMKDLKIILPLIGLYLVAQNAACQDVVAMKVRRTLTYNSCDGPGTPELSTFWVWGETPDTIYIAANGTICKGNYHKVIVRTSGTGFASSTCKIKIPGAGCVQETERIQDSIYYYLFPQIPPLPPVCNWWLGA